MQFLMGRHDKEASQIYRDDHETIGITCCHCGSGKVGVLPPFNDPHPTVWTCFDCRGEFSVHNIGNITSACEGNSPSEQVTQREKTAKALDELGKLDGETL